MASYHCSIKARQPATGSSAAAHCAYMMRIGKYGRKPAARDELAASGQGGLPTWAKDARTYFRAADDLETAGKIRGRQAKAAKAKAEAEGREYVPADGVAVSAYSADIALPHELDDSQRESLARGIVAMMAATEDGRTLPHAWAIHRPQPDSLNWHMHILLGTRAEAPDDMPRPTPEAFFGPARKAGGGARKVAEVGSRPWVKKVRAAVADLQNQALQAAGLEARVDHRTLAEQGVDRAPLPRLTRGQWEAQAAEAAAQEAQQAAEAAEEQARQAEHWQGVQDSYLEATRAAVATAEQALAEAEAMPEPEQPRPQPQPQAAKPKAKKKRPRPLVEAQLAPAVIPAVDTVIDHGPGRDIEPFQPAFFESYRAACQAVLDHQPALTPEEQAESLAAVAVHYSGLMYQRETDTDLALQLMAAIKPSLGQEAQAELATYHAGQWTCRDVVAFRPDSIATFDRTLRGAELDPPEDTRPEPEQKPKPSQSPGMCLTLNLRPGQ